MILAQRTFLLAGLCTTGFNVPHPPARAAPVGSDPVVPTVFMGVCLLFLRHHVFSQSVCSILMQIMGHLLYKLIEFGVNTLLFMQASIEAVVPFW